MDKKELNQIEFTSSKEALELSKYANSQKSMMYLSEIVKCCENEFASEKDTELKQKRIYQTVYLAGLVDGVRKERAKRKGKIHQKVLDLELNSNELGISLEKLNLLTNDLREDFFGYDKETSSLDILYYYDDFAIKCDIIRDYVFELQAIANNISCLVNKF